MNLQEEFKKNKAQQISKYDDEIALDDNDVHTLVMKKIKPESKVLEFGCAGGRFTRILKEKMGCRVYIVECEEKAYIKAADYAYEGLCSDILKYEWLKWSGKNFDHVIFTDVLEHLYDPTGVLKAVHKVIDPDGSILISLPNIAHNDVLTKLYDNSFEYTDIGLLDDTHIHFFAENSLDRFFESAGYKIVSKEYKKVSSGMTEQYRDQDYDICEELQRALERRVNGEVYQFVLEVRARDKEFNLTKQPLQYSAHRGWLYTDSGQGYSQDECEPILGDHYAAGIYRFNIFVEKAIGTKLRFDPIEGAACLVRIDGITGAKLCAAENYYHESYWIRLNSTDPRIEFEATGEKTCISLLVDFNASAIEDHACKLLEKRTGKIRILNNKLESELRINKDLQSRYQEKEDQLSELRTMYREKEDQLSELRSRYQNMEERLSEKENELSLIYNSKGFKALTKMRDIKSGLFGNT